MKPYLISLALGLVVGAIYGLSQVRSPAPPIIALVGLLGMLLGEQLVPIVKRMASPHPVSMSWLRDDVITHLHGSKPMAPNASITLPHGDETHGES